MERKRQALDVSNWGFSIDNEKRISHPKSYLMAFDPTQDQESPIRAFERDASDSSQENFTSRPSTTSSITRESISVFSGASSRRTSLKPNPPKNQIENIPNRIDSNEGQYKQQNIVINRPIEPKQNLNAEIYKKSNLIEIKQKRESEAAEERDFQKRRADLSDFERSIVERAKIKELPFNETIKNLTFDSQEESSQINPPRRARDSMASVFNEMNFDTSDEELEHRTRMNTLQNSIIQQIPLEDINESDFNVGSPMSTDTIPNEQAMDSEDEEFFYNPGQGNVSAAPSVARKAPKKINKATPDTNEKFGLKRKLVTPSQDNEQRRYPKRNRIKPVQHWRNERIVYDESNRILGVDVKEEGYLTRSDAKIYNRQPKKPKLRNQVTQEQCELPVFDSRSKKEVLEKVVYPKSNWVSDEEAKGKIAHVGEDDKIRLIVISLKPGDSFDFGITNSRIVGIIMMSGIFSTQITIHESILNLSQWDIFCVPPKNKLTITNNSPKCYSKVHLQIEKI
ncbi:unnamed protein product [Blepharisma stoltei]|uniref:Uncharacterized protein n=1 Tax=Blepharisma stoltei TaxID=1481888 RepID=A0AAU9IYK2_9CILI|nr:unnamed protein product [Blepharisma stoltei]